MTLIVSALFDNCAIQTTDSRMAVYSADAQRKLTASHDTAIKRYNFLNGSVSMAIAGCYSVNRIELPIYFREFETAEFETPKELINKIQERLNQDMTEQEKGEGIIANFIFKNDDKYKLVEISNFIYDGLNHIANPNLEITQRELEEGKHIVYANGNKEAIREFYFQIRTAEETKQTFENPSDLIKTIFSRTIEKLNSIPSSQYIIGGDLNHVEI